jgi:intracellular sulfur oxidation DsrE/DsrF family protein
MHEAGPLVAGILAVLLASSSAAMADEPAEGPLKVVVHVNFAETGQQGHGLKNVANVIREVGKEHAAVVVVCHGGGIGLVEAARTEFAAQVAELQALGVTFVACQNTMRTKSIRPEDLLPGVGMVPSGTLEVIRKQQAGYAYFKP